MDIFKKITIPTGETKELVALENWSVRWYSRYGGYSGDTRPECEIFTSEKDAKEFRDSLENAFKLIKHTHGTKVTIEQTK